MTQMLSFGFMQRALLVGLMVGVTCSAVGFFVVLRRLAFMGIGISHAALGGVAIGAVLGVDPVAVGAVFGIGAAACVAAMARGGEVHGDTALGIVFSAGMALGVAVLSASRGYYGDLFGYLFGNILAVTPRDVCLVAATGVAILAFLGIYFPQLFSVCFHEELARADGLPVDRLNMGLLALVALAVVVCVRVAGVVLASALLVVPAAAAHRLARGYRGMFAGSLAAGVTSALGGLVLSYILDIAPGPAIVLCATALYAAAAVAGARRR